MTNIYFLVKGKVGYVLPKYDNVVYRNVRLGDHFGLIDILASMRIAAQIRENVDFDNWIQHKDILLRQFSVMSIIESEALMLGLSDLNRMRTEFHEAYDKLFGSSERDLQIAYTMRLKATKYCEEKGNELLNESVGAVSMKSEKGEPINISAAMMKRDTKSIIP